MSFRILAFIIWGAFLSACASAPKETYSERLNSRPTPQNAEQHQTECAWVRSEIARMRSVRAQAATSNLAAYFQATADQNIAALESHAAKLRCNAAFSSVSPNEAPINTSTIEQCISACKSNTSRTSEQCFDACNK
jgi:divalent metal cation (Fe/Co/Zn/Cd) transporter